MPRPYCPEGTVVQVPSQNLPSPCRIRELNSAQEAAYVLVADPYHCRVSPPDLFLPASSPHTWGIHGPSVSRFSWKVVVLNSKWLLPYSSILRTSSADFHISQGKKTLPNLNTKITIVSGFILQCGPSCQSHQADLGTAKTAKVTDFLSTSLVLTPTPSSYSRERNVVQGIVAERAYTPSLGLNIQDKAFAVFIFHACEPSSPQLPPEHDRFLTLHSGTS